MGSSSGSEYCASENISNRAGSTGKVGCRTITLLGVVWYEVWVFLCKSKNVVSTTYSASPTTPTEGVISE